MKWDALEYWPAVALTTVVAAAQLHPGTQQGGAGPGWVGNAILGTLVPVWGKPRGLAQSAAPAPRRKLLGRKPY